MNKRKKKKAQQAFGSLPEPDGTPLRLCQNPQTGMLYLNRLATPSELDTLSALLLGRK